MLRMLGKEERATPTLTAWLSSSPCPAPRNAPDGTGAKDRREVSNQRPRPNPGPPRPFPGEPLPQRVGGKEGRWKRVWGRLLSPSPFRDRQPLFPAAQRPDTCEAAELKKHSGKDAAGSPAVPAPALYPWLRVGPLAQLSLAHLSAGETAEIRPVAPQCVPAPDARPLPQHRVGFPSALLYTHLG